MAVEASHITLFSPPPNTFREMIFHNETDSTPVSTFRSLNGFASALPVSRKRSRDSFSFNPSLINATNVDLNQHQFDQFGEFTFLNEDISLQMYQQQLEIDQLIFHHTENVKTEIEEMRKQNSRRLIASIHEGITKRLRTKDEEILKMGQINWSLEEKVKSLMIENQILKESVQTNEATANALRNKLQLVLAQIQLQHQQQQQHHDLTDNITAKAMETGTALVDDAESCCGGNYEEDDTERKVRDNNDDSSKLKCRSCGKEESCVLLVPCRHLCVCTSCVSSLNVCPICNSAKSAVVVVNMSLF